MSRHETLTISVFNYYTPDYQKYIDTFNATYSGCGDITQTKIDQVNKEIATSIKSAIWQKHVQQTPGYDFYVFADADLLFRNDFCFSELCIEDQVSVVYRPELLHIPQRVYNTSIVVVPQSKITFIDDWASLSDETVIDGLQKKDLVDNRIPNEFYWDQITINHLSKKYQYHQINCECYLGQHLTVNADQVKIVTPNAYNPTLKEEIYERLKNEIRDYWPH